MLKPIYFAITCIICVEAVGQKKALLPFYFSTQYDKTLYDKTYGNNSWGIGAGIQVFVNVRSKWEPIVDITDDIYLDDDKVSRLDPEGNQLPSVHNMANIFGGISYFLGGIGYLSFVTGPSYIGNQRLLGVKPSIGLFLSKSQHAMVKFAFINVFDRGTTEKGNFGLYSFTLAFRFI